MRASSQREQVSPLIARQPLAAKTASFPTFNWSTRLLMTGTGAPETCSIITVTITVCLQLPADSAVTQNQAAPSAELAQVIGQHTLPPKQQTTLDHSRDNSETEISPCSKKPKTTQKQEVMKFPADNIYHICMCVPMVKPQLSGNKLLADNWPNEAGDTFRSAGLS